MEFNLKHLEEFGFEYDELDGHHVSKIFTDRSIQTFPGAYHDLMSCCPVNGSEFELKRKDSSVIPVEVHAGVFNDPNGQPQEARCIMRDLTERKLLETELRQAQKMENPVGRRHGP